MNYHFRQNDQKSDQREGAQMPEGKALRFVSSFLPSVGEQFGNPIPTAVALVGRFDPENVQNELKRKWKIKLDF